MFAELGCISIIKETVKINYFILNFAQDKAVRFLLKCVSDVP